MFVSIVDVELRASVIVSILIRLGWSDHLNLVVIWSPPVFGDNTRYKTFVFVIVSILIKLGWSENLNLVVIWSPPVFGG